MKVLISLACALLVLMFSFSALALIDNFGDGRADGWTVIQGDWLIKDGKYVQKDTEWISTETNETYHRTFLGDVNWTDYTVEAVFSTLAITDISIQSATGAISIVWTSVDGKTYAVHYSNGPMDASMTWTVAETGIAASGTGTNTWTDDGSFTGGLPALERYYKVEVLPN